MSSVTANANSPAPLIEPQYARQGEREVKRIQDASGYDGAEIKWVACDKCCVSDTLEQNFSPAGVGSAKVADGMTDEETTLLTECLRRFEQKKAEMEKHSEKEKQKWVTTKRLGYSPGKHMMRLARLYQVTDVRKFISGVNANIYMAKNNKGVDKKEIKAAVVQMQQVIQRARVKIKNLDQEVLKTTLGKSAGKRMQMEKARAIERELKRKMVARRAREYAEAGAALHTPIIGIGKAPWERWEDSFEKTPEEITAIAATIAQDIQVSAQAQPTLQQAVEVGQVEQQSCVAATVDIYI